MKFDRFMTVCYRIISILLVIIVLGGFAVSCFRSPLSACADELDILASIFAYEDVFRENLIIVNQNVTDALNDSSLSDVTKAKIRAVLALQELALRTMPDIYGNPIEPILPDSDTVTLSGSGASGLYRSALDNNIHAVTVLSPLSTGTYTNPVTCTFAVSDEFTYTLQFVPASNSSLQISGVNNSYLPGVPIKKYGYYYNGRVIGVGDSYLNDFNLVSNSLYIDATFGCYVTTDNNIPTVSRYYAYNTSTNFPDLRKIGASGQSVSLPVATVDTSSPWNYYNDTLLPYIHNNFSDVTNNYIVFPNGYHVYPPPDPTEPATFPNGGIYIDNQYNIGINIVYPTDASGQPLTDASGETVTETQYITDTSPLDGEYSFRMPTLPRLNMYDATLPNPDVSAYSDGIGFIWNACYNILTDTGFMPVVMICFSLALIGFILWKLGG